MSSVDALIPTPQKKTGSTDLCLFCSGMPSVYHLSVNPTATPPPSPQTQSPSPCSLGIQDTEPDRPVLPGREEWLDHTRKNQVLLRRMHKEQ